MAIYNSLSDNLIRQIKEDQLHNHKNPYACSNDQAIRRYENHDIPKLWRPAFVMDVDKILHNNFYNRYSDKTQVFSCFKNDDISRRALHVQLVSRIARTIGMSLNLNLDLIEAISLGHDIGHTPFGHAGERTLNTLYYANTGRMFNHNVHSVRILDKLIQRNVSLQVLDGVISHNGEMECSEYRPMQLNDFEQFDKIVEACYTDTSACKNKIPATLEGCVMRISDIIAYLGKDRQDAIRLGLIEDMEAFTDESIGTTNAEIINNITVSIIEHSYNKPYISMDPAVFQALSNAKKENYSLIYNNNQVNDLYNHSIAPKMEKLYNTLLIQAKHLSKNDILYKHHIKYLAEANQFTHYSSNNAFLEQYLSQDPNEIVTDYIASMTDDYLIELYYHLFPSETNDIIYQDYFN